MITPMNIHYYCPDCYELLVPENNLTCGICEKIYDTVTLKHNNNCLYYFPLQDQLRSLLNKYSTTLRKENMLDSDVVNSRTYKKFRQQNVIRDCDISIQWNTDGIKVLKFSKISMWPIQVSINELPYRIRK